MQTPQTLQTSFFGQTLRESRAVAPRIGFCAGRTPFYLGLDAVYRQGLASVQQRHRTDLQLSVNLPEVSPAAGVRQGGERNDGAGQNTKSGCLQCWLVVGTDALIHIWHHDHQVSHRPSTIPTIGFGGGCL